jgi:hypothetical protein
MDKSRNHVKITWWQTLIIYGSLFLPWVNSYALGAKYGGKAVQRVNTRHEKADV